MPTVFYTSPGSHTFTVPAGVTSVSVQGIGTGGWAASDPGDYTGGGAAYAASVLTVTPGWQLIFFLFDQEGEQGGPDNPGVGITIIRETSPGTFITMYHVTGGVGGTYSINPGKGGLASSCIANGTTFDGGDGEVIGTGDLTGGGSGGSSGAGADGSAGGAGGAGTAPSGDGGHGVAFGCTGACWYIWTGSAWSLDGSTTCDCDCEPPGFNGSFIGQMMGGDCLNTPVTAEAAQQYGGGGGKSTNEPPGRFQPGGGGWLRFDYEASAYTWHAAGRLILSGALGQADYSYEAVGPLILSGASPSSSGALILMDGGLTLSGEASVVFGTFYRATGALFLSGEAAPTVLKYQGRGRLRLTGSARSRYAIYTDPYDGSGTLTLSGLARTVWGVPVLGTGPLLLSGEASAAATGNSASLGRLQLRGIASASFGYTYSYEGSGTLAFSGESVESFGYVYDEVTGGLTFSGIATARPQQIGVLNTRWRVRRRVVGILNTIWQTGERPLGFFRVTGKCKQDKCPPVDGGCSGSPISKRNYIVNVLAHNVGEVCEKLIAMQFKHPIAKIEQFTNRAFLSDPAPPGEAPTTLWGDAACNRLVDVTPPLTLVKCQELFIDFQGGEGWVAHGFFQRHYDFEPEGSLAFTGDSGTPTALREVEGTGSLGFSGIPYIEASDWHYEGDGDLNLSAEILLVMSHWEWAAEGSLYLVGDSPIEKDQWGWEGGGQLFALTSNQGGEESWAVTGIARTGSGGFHVGGVGLIGLGGAWDGGGQLLLTGEADQARSVWEWDGSGELVLSGPCLLALGNHEYQGGGYLWLHGGAPFQFHGGFGVTGSALANVGVYYEAGGLLTLSGAAGVIASVYDGGGSLSMSGRAAAVTDDEGTKWTTWAWGDKDPQIQVIFPYTPAPAAPLGVTTPVPTDCCPLDLPRIIAVDHQMSTAGLFGRFLKRNNMSLPARIGITYSQPLGAWYEAVHFTGYSAAYPLFERWTVVFTLRCLGLVAGAATAESYLEFGTMIRYEPDSGGERVTKVRVCYETSVFCPRDKALLSFPFVIDTGTGTATPSPKGGTVFTDEIGLFKTGRQPRPRIRFKLSDGPADVQEAEVDLGPALQFVQELAAAAVKG